MTLPPRSNRPGCARSNRDGVPKGARRTPARSRPRYGGTVEHVKRRGYDEETAREATQIAWKLLLTERPELLQDPSAARAWLRRRALWEAGRISPKHVPPTVQPHVEGEDRDPLADLVANDLHWLHGNVESLDPEEGAEASERQKIRALWCVGVRCVLEGAADPDDVALVKAELDLLESIGKKRRPKGEGSAEDRTRLHHARARLRAILEHYGFWSSDPLDPLVPGSP